MDNPYIITKAPPCKLVLPRKYYPMPDVLARKIDKIRRRWGKIPRVHPDFPGLSGAQRPDIARKTREIIDGYANMW